MQRSTQCILAAAAITASFSVAAAEVDSLSMSSNLTYGYGSEVESSIQGELELAPEIEASFSQRASLVASARLRLDAEDELEPDGHSYDTYSGASRPASLGDTGSAELRDFYLEFRAENGLARFGKQQIVWGRLDGIKVLDLLNPQDFREFIVDDFGDSRIGLWSAYFDYSVGDWRAELALVPDSTGHAIPASGAWFELTAPRFRYGADPGQAAPPVVTVEPGHALDDTAVGLRLSRPIGAAEFSAVAYTGIDPEPLGRLVLRNGQPTVERFYERRDAIGFSFDMGLGPAVARVEYAYQPERVFNTRSTSMLDTAELDQHRGAIGVDIDAPGGVFVNVQYLVDSVSAAPDDLVRPAEDRIGTLFLKKNFAYDTISLEARWYHSFTDDDDLASLSVEYAFSDSTTLELAAQAFSGNDGGLFGQFAERDRIIISLRHIF